MYGDNGGMPDFVYREPIDPVKAQYIEFLQKQIKTKGDEIKKLKELMRVQEWYLMYHGSSPDGLGYPKYVGRTKDFDTARTFYLNNKKNPYWTWVALNSWSTSTATIKPYVI